MFALDDATATASALSFGGVTLASGADALAYLIRKNPPGISLLLLNICCVYQTYASNQVPGIR